MDHHHFICPVQRTPLRVDGDMLVGDEQRYPIRRGVPRFVADSNYADAFGLQWNTFKKTQFDSHTQTSITESRLEQAFGRPLAQLRGLRVLEAGSGAGRFTEVLLKHGALVYSFDFSSAVDANHDNNMPNVGLTLFQADIGNIPLESDFFDAVVCLGVLQHTPSTPGSLKELRRVLKQGGQIVCDRYKYHPGNFTSLYMVWWYFIKRLAPARQLAVTDRLTQFFFPIHWTFKDAPLAQMLLRRVSPINFYYGRFDLPKDILFEWSRLDTHDRNTDHFKRHVTKRGFEHMFEVLGFARHEVFVGGTGYVGRAFK